MKLCWCIFQPAYVSSESGNFSARVVENFPWSADLSKAIQSLPSVAGVAYILGSGEEGLQLQPENPKISL